MRRRSLFVCLKCIPSSGPTVEDRGLPVIAGNDKTYDFPLVVMTLELNIEDFWQRSKVWNELRYFRYDDSTECIFPADDLPALCTSLLQVHEFSSFSFRIIVDQSIGASLMEGDDGSPCPRSKLARLLNPLRQLHSMEVLSLEGPGSAQYKAEIMASIGDRQDSVKEMIDKASAATDQGDAAYNAGSLTLAIRNYKNALNVVRSSSLEDFELDEVLEDGLYAGKIAGWYVVAYEFDLYPFTS